VHFTLALRYFAVHIPLPSHPQPSLHPLICGPARSHTGTGREKFRLVLSLSQSFLTHFPLALLIVPVSLPERYDRIVNKHQYSVPEMSSKALTGKAPTFSNPSTNTQHHTIGKIPGFQKNKL
jgi:hypothetical protein